MRIRMGYPDLESERRILEALAFEDPLDRLEPFLGSEEVSEIQKSVRAVKVDEALMNYGLQIAERTRQHEYLSLGVSPRGTMGLYRAAQSLALLEGRDYCIVDDFKRLVVPVFAHRLWSAPATPLQ